jgi:hypothetical protein
LRKIHLLCLPLFQGILLLLHFEFLSVLCLSGFYFKKRQAAQAKKVGAGEGLMEAPILPNRKRV